MRLSEPELQVITEIIFYMNIIMKTAVLEVAPNFVYNVGVVFFVNCHVGPRHRKTIRLL